MPVGRTPAQVPTALRLAVVMRIAPWPAEPARGPFALHAPPPAADRSKERKPSNAFAVAKPLMAPLQSPTVLTQAPSTQLPTCETVSVIALGEKFADSRVPVQVPDMSANGPVGVPGEGAG